MKKRTEKPPQRRNNNVPQMNNNLTSYIITTRNIRCWYKRYKYTLLTCRLRNKAINILEEKEKPFAIGNLYH